VYAVADGPEVSQMRMLVETQQDEGGWIPVRPYERFVAEQSQWRNLEQQISSGALDALPDDHLIVRLRAILSALAAGALVATKVLGLSEKLNIETSRLRIAQLTACAPPSLKDLGSGTASLQAEVDRLARYHRTLARALEMDEARLSPNVLRSRDE
jgi:hypothetical protein